MEQDRLRAELEQDHECVVEELRQVHNTNGGIRADDKSVQDRVHAYTAQRQQRIQQFLEHVNKKRDDYFNNLLSDRTRCSNHQGAAQVAEYVS